MVYSPSPEPPSPDELTTDLAISTKIVIAGGFGAGKTTMVGTVSEIPPVSTEALMTEASEAFDDLTGTPEKVTTTVAMDFGRLTLESSLVLYLFGTPGQDRFWFMWDDLVRGAIGAVVLADTRRLSACFPALNYFEKYGTLPFIVALNCFDGVLSHPVEEVREALMLDPSVPIVTCDARDDASVRDVLGILVGHALAAAAAVA